MSEQYLKLPDTATEAGSRYFRAYMETLRLFTLIIDTVITGDYGQFVLKRALNNEDWKHVKGPGELAETDPGPRTKALRKCRQTLFEMILVRAVDNFEVYVSDLMRNVLSVKPEILKSTEPTLSIEYVLGFINKDELIRDLVERKVQTLSYKGFAELQYWCEERGISIVVDSDKRVEIIELIAIRNLISHNRGLVDERYLRMVPQTKALIGERRKLGIDYVLEALQTLNMVVENTDVKVREKFSITTQVIWPEVENDKEIKDAILNNNEQVSLESPSKPTQDQPQSINML